MPETTRKAADAAKNVADTGAETARAGCEQARTFANQGAEQAQQFAAAGQEATKEAIERSLGALNELNAANRRNLEAMVASVTAATKGAEQLGSQAVDYSKRSMDDSVSAARAITQAKSVQEVVELQTQYAKQALETYMGELNRWSETVSQSFKESVKPLNERASAAIERAQGDR